MPKRVKVSKAATADLRAIARYTQLLWGSAQRYEYLALLNEHFELLASNPRIGTRRDEYKPGLLSSPVGRHTVFYRDGDSDIRIIRVLHQSMDHQQHLSAADDA